MGFFDSVFSRKALSAEQLMADARQSRDVCRFRRAEKQMTKALTQAETGGRDRLVAESLMFLSGLRRTRHKRHQAVKDAARAAEIFSALGDTNGEYRALRLHRTARAFARF